MFHFLRFRASPSPGNVPAGPTSASGGAVVDTDQRLATKDVKLPVLWHQCLLAFAQRYRNDITEDQREALLDLLLARSHRDIGPEIRRELLEGRGRGVVLEDGAGVVGEGGDDTMVMG